MSDGITITTVKKIGNTYGVKDLVDKGYSIKKIDDKETSYLAKKGTETIIIKIISRNKHSENGKDNNHHNKDIKPGEFKEYDSCKIYTLHMLIDFEKKTYESYLIEFNNEASINLKKEIPFKANGTFL